MELRKLSPIPYGSLIFAPMEGITDETFRKTILKLYPEWDYVSCDFLRVPSAGRYPVKHLVRHVGKETFQIPWVMEKTLYQILTSHSAFTEQMLQDLEKLKIPWVDINLGCPSNTVTRNKGGSFLLKDLLALRPLIKTIRANFHGRLSAKIRIGFEETSGFEDSIKLLNDEGIELITVHARTREDMYKVPARWEFIRRAVEISSVPIIGNGDIWKTADIDRMLKETGCHGVMIARGALKSPWMARDYRQGHLTETESERFQKIREFFSEYRAQLEAENVTMRGLLKQGKSVSRYMVEGMTDGEQLRRKLILSQSAPEFFEVIDNL